MIYHILRRSNRSLAGSRQRNLAQRVAFRRILPRYTSILMQRWQRMAHSSAWRSAAALAHGQSGRAARLKAARINR